MTRRALSTTEPALRLGLSNPALTIVLSGMS